MKVTESQGAVCAINGVGCPADDCFCACADLEECRYWAYFERKPDGRWEGSTEGAQERIVESGDVEGWAWGPGMEKAPSSAPDYVRAAGLGMRWLRESQLDDGSIGGHAGVTADAVIAARATGTNASVPWAGSSSAMEYLEQNALAYATIGPAQAGKLAAAVAAGGGDPTDFGAIDLASLLMASYEGSSGRFGSSVWDQAWAVIGLAAADREVPPAAVARLTQYQTADGGWGVVPGDAADPDSTGLAMQALIAAHEGPTAPSVQKALSYLQENHLDSGAWGHTDEESSTNSTALVIQGLLAVRENPLSGSWESGSGKGPVDYVVGQQLLDGRFQYDAPPADLMATVQAVAALAGRHQPIPGRRVAGERTAEWIMAQQRDDGSFRSSNTYVTTAANVDAVLALAALGHNPNVASPSGRTAGDYLREEAQRFANQGPMSAARMSLAAAALGSSPRSFGGVDLVEKIMSSYDDDTGAFGPESTLNNAWAILGLAAAEAPMPQAGVEFLKAARNADGGWGPDVNDDEIDAGSSGWALQALAAAGVPTDDPAVWRGVEAIRRLQRVTGAFVGPTAVADPELTARAIGGLAGIGHDVEGYGWSRSLSGHMTANSPVDALIELQNGDGSYSNITGQTDTGVTYIAALGLSLEPLPLQVRGRGGSTVLYLPNLMRGH
jgi:prenyltransferase beta subunit